MKSILLVMVTVLVVGCHSPSKRHKEPEQLTAEQELRKEEAARRLHYIEEHPDLPQPVKWAIEHGDVVVGMTETDARASIGEPDQISSRGSEHGAHEQWEYQTESGHHRWLYFDGGTLSTWTPTR